MLSQYFLHHIKWGGDERRGGVTYNTTRGKVWKNMEEKANGYTGSAAKAAPAAPVNYLKELTKYYFIQVSKGCGRAVCHTPGCLSNNADEASNNKPDAMKVAQVLLKKAVELTAKSAPLCPAVVGPFTYQTLAKLASGNPDTPTPFVNAAARYVTEAFSSINSIKGLFIHGMVEYGDDPSIDFDDMHQCYSLIQANVRKNRGFHEILMFFRYFLRRF
jgi:hypothetical protein